MSSEPAAEKPSHLHPSSLFFRLAETSTGGDG